MTTKWHKKGRYGYGGPEPYLQISNEDYSSGRTCSETGSEQRRNEQRKKKKKKRKKMEWELSLMGPKRSLKETKMIQPYKWKKNFLCAAEPHW